MGRTYLYGIIEGRNEDDLGIAGVDGSSPVHVAAGDGLGCVVSGYSGEEFGALPKEQLVRHLLSHQRVIEGVMDDHAVLPVKFGTLLDSSQEVRALLSQGHSEFARALASIRDKVEIEVAATWDTGQVLQEIGSEEEVARAREAIARKGQPTVEDRIWLGQMVKSYMDKRREGHRERMVGFLKPLSVDVAVNALVSDELVMNVAFLVDRDRQREFDEGVQRLDELFQNEINFRVIGPLPAYSFSTVEVTRLTPEQVEEARQTLHLGNVITEAEVRKAYRRLAAEEQRNLSPGDELAKGRFARLRQASELLLSCCRVRTAAKGGKRHSALTSQAIDGLFAIAIKGSQSDEVEPARFGGAVEG